MAGNWDSTTQRIYTTPKVAGGGASPQFIDDLTALAIVAMGILDCVVDADEPGDTGQLWYDVSGS